MPHSIRGEQLRRYRLNKLGIGTRIETIPDIIDANGGINACNIATPYLALLCRSVKNPFAALNKEQLKTRKITKIRAMRGNVYMMPTRRLPLILGAFISRPRIMSKYYKSWGVQEDNVVENRRRLMESLRMGPKSQKELRAQFPDLASVQLIGTGSERTNLLNLILQSLQMEGELIIEKSVTGETIRNTQVYVALRALFPKLPPIPNREDCLPSLIKWYFQIHGPADFDDLAWWTGINKVLLKKSIEKVALEQIEINGDTRPQYMLAEDIDALRATKGDETGDLTLLPPNDPYLKGHKNTSFFLSGVPEQAVFERGESRPTIVVDGRVVGLWRLVEHGDELLIGVDLFDEKVVDPEKLRIAKESTIAFTHSHLGPYIDNLIKGIITGCEVYA